MTVFAQLFHPGYFPLPGPPIAEEPPTAPPTQPVRVDEPRRELKLQAVRFGDVAAIAAIPCEVYALSGLKMKGMSPLPNTFTMSLANGSEGYIPPPVIPYTGHR